MDSTAFIQELDAFNAERLSPIVEAGADVASGRCARRRQPAG